MQHEGYQVAPRSSMNPSIEDRLSPASEFLQGFGPPYQDDRRDVRRSLEGPGALLPVDVQQSSYGSARGLGTLDRSDSQLSWANSSFRSLYSASQTSPGYEPLRFPSDPMNSPNAQDSRETSVRPQQLTSHYPWNNSHQISQDHLDYGEQSTPKRSTITVAGPLGGERSPKRYRGGRDEFEGSVQYLEKPPRNLPEPRERDLPTLPIHLDNGEQEDILTQVNKRLSQCAFDFVALYRFPIPIEPNKPAVQIAADKAWTEWAYLLKRLATKRKIPSHSIYQGQIKELTTVLDNSLEMRHATKPQPRALKDDRTVLQFISAGIQVGKMLKDASAMEYLDKLYRQTQNVIQERTESPQVYR